MFHYRFSALFSDGKYKFPTIFAHSPAFFVLFIVTLNCENDIV